MDEKIMRLRELLNKSHYTIAVTGAGISVSAGIMAFAGMNLPAVLQMTSTTILKTAPGHYYNVARKAFLGPMFENGPTLAHRKLAALEKLGLLQGIITTNIDCLHTLAGSENVAEIQGSFAVNKCLKCGRHYDDVQIWNQGKCPRCESCGGTVGAFPIYHHIGLISGEVQKARNWAARAELVLVIGSNGPYCDIYFEYIRPEANIVQINPKASAFDSVAAVNIRQTADEVFRVLC